MKILFYTITLAALSFGAMHGMDSSKDARAKLAQQPRRATRASRPRIVNFITHLPGTHDFVTVPMLFDNNQLLYPPPK